MKYIIFLLVFLCGYQFHIDARKLPPRVSDGGVIEIPDGFTKCDIDLIKYADEGSFLAEINKTNKQGCTTDITFIVTDCNEGIKDIIEFGDVIIHRYYQSTNLIGAKETNLQNETICALEEKTCTPNNEIKYCKK